MIEVAAKQHASFISCLFDVCRTYLPVADIDLNHVRVACINTGTFHDGILLVEEMLLATSHSFKMLKTAATSKKSNARIKSTGNKSSGESNMLTFDVDDDKIAQVT